MKVHHLQRQTRTLSTNGRIVAGCVRQRSDPAQFDLSDVSFTAKRAAMADFADKFNITEVAQWILADGGTLPVPRVLPAKAL